MLFRRQSGKVSHPLIQQLQEQGILTPGAAESIRLRLEEKPDMPILEAMAAFLTREELLVARAAEMDNRFPPFDLTRDRRKLQAEALDLLPLDEMRRHGCLCKKIENGSVELVMVDPLDDLAIGFVEELTGYRVSRRLVTLREEFEAFLADYEKQKKAEGERPARTAGEKLEGVRSEAVARRLAYALDNLTLVREGDVEVFRGIGPILDSIIKRALLREASDIHLEPMRDGFRIRFRIDGILLEDPEVEKILSRVPRDRNTLNTFVNIIKNRSGDSGKEMRLDEREKAQDGRIYLPGADLDLRVSVVPTMHGESTVIRIHYREIGEFDLDQLGFEPDVLRKFRSVVEAPYGLVLVSGPTGSGKTTTLYASMKLINSPKKKILTIEDPIEYSIEGALQAQTNRYKAFTFAEALRSFLRHDPDVIMVGEIRDSDTAQMAVEAALTGHLVLSSIHANDAASTITRLKELGVDPRLATATCRGTLAQRLVRKVCESCKRQHIFSTRFYNLLDSHKVPYDPRKLVRGAGCEKCNHTGYRGRVGIFELLIPTFEVKEMILKGATPDEITEVARSQGMRTLLEDCLYKVARGLTTEEEVWRVTLLDSRAGG
ncbi:MAG TPA: GspE/PulE family protein [Candidatus Nitrosotenuis sp.]|jgi:type II secretory ATPase GspE/PulE/Tfp pilus assembly ATPase PilB-like protein|nr:GspE/PulE family protein [Candidatus Nitrosotenuis sp.]